MKPVRTLDPEPGEIISISGALHHQSTVFSFWRPSWRDIIRLLMGRPIRLASLGAGRITIDTEE